MKAAGKAGIVAVAAVVALSGCSQVRKFRTRAEMVAEPACQDFSLPIYFQEGSDRLTRDALQVIDRSTAQVKACQVQQVSVTGLADADGSAQRNMELSRRRATSVARILADRGWPTPAFDIAAAGEAGAATAVGQAPLRRRTEIQVKFASSTPVR